MAKTIILGNNPQRWWMEGMPGIPIINVPNIPSNKSTVMMDFISTLPKDTDCMVIDADSLDVENTELPLLIAMYVRLMLHTCLKTSLCQICIVTDLDWDIYRGYGVQSMLLMTQGISIIKGFDVQNAIAITMPLTPSEYVEGFLNLIKIEPKEKIEGRHSIANEWGAYILAQSICAGKQENTTRPLGSSEYFLYSSIVALNAADIELIIKRQSSWEFKTEIRVTEKISYLLIDDEASKGWSETLRLLMPNAEGFVWDKKAIDYESLGQDIRKDIESCKFDIIFLDLRMNGIEEEKNSNPEDFSGMKILRAIKRINPGIQIIMLTATNKGWNVKAMLDAGADGYYMKESPEYHFPPSYTEQNTLALHNEIKKCYNRRYLMDIYRKIKKVDLNPDGGLARIIESQLAISFDLLRKANTPTDFAFSYIALEQVFEISVNHLYKEDSLGNTWKCFLSNTEGQLLEYDSSYLRRKFNIKINPSLATPVWVKVAVIYYGLFNGQDKGLISNIKDDIKLRNDYIHDNDKPLITADDYQNLFDSVFEFLSVFE